MTSTPVQSDPIVAFLDTFRGRWPGESPSPVDCAPGQDPWHATVVGCDLPPTGSGPLDGLRMVVKDNIAVGGLPMAIGTGAPGFLARADATIVERARRAGARIVAKGQCEALLLGANSFSSRPYPVLNPHAPERSAGGSSSGSAVAVAAEQADLALGTDSGGSIRIPAAFCGIVGFTPSRGRLPYTGIAPLEPYLERAGPMARDVASVRALFEVLDGPDGFDPRCGWAGKRDDSSACVPPRIAALGDAVDSADPPVRDTLRAALARLGTERADIQSFTWSALDEAQQLHLAIYVAGQAMVAASDYVSAGFAAAAPAGWPAWRSALGENAIPAPLAGALAAGAALVAADPDLYSRAVRRGRAIADQLDAALAGYDALLLPTTVGLPPLRPGMPSDDELYGDTSFTAPFNVTGSPAISMPCGRASGLPVGLQLVGRRGADAALLDTASWVEAVLNDGLGVSDG